MFRFHRDTRIRILIFALLGTIGAVPFLDAQYIRIGNAEAIPNGADTIVGIPYKTRMSRGSK